MTPTDKPDGVLPMTFDDGSRLIATCIVDGVPHQRDDGMPNSVTLMRYWRDRDETLRYVPEDASAGVVVPGGIRAWAQGVSANSIPWQAETIRAANWILSLPAAPLPDTMSAHATTRLFEAHAAADEVDRASGDAPHSRAFGLAAWIRGREELHRLGFAAATRTLTPDDIALLEYAYSLMARSHPNVAVLLRDLVVRLQEKHHSPSNS